MKKTYKILASRWREYLLEILVIIFGILIAFGLNNWKTAKDNRAEEQKMLKVLSQEFSGNIESLDLILQAHNNNIENINALLPKPLDSNTQMTGQEVLLEMYGAIYGNTYNPMFGVYNSLLNSEKLNIIENENLRYSIASLPGIINDYTEEEEIILKVNLEMILPDMLQINPKEDYEENVFLNNLLGALNSNLSGAIQEGNNLIEEMMRILSLINSEIG